MEFALAPPGPCVYQYARASREVSIMIRASRNFEQNHGYPEKQVDSLGLFRRYRSTERFS